MGLGTHTPSALEALLHDLALGGVMVEVGDAPANWTKQDIRVPQDIRVSGYQDIRGEPATPQRNQLPVTSHQSRAAVAQAVPMPLPVATAAAQVEGEPGGVVAICAARPSEAEQKLLGNMLAAVGLDKLPRAIAFGNAGLADAVRGQQPTHVLVLGQAPLAALGGVPLSVEDGQKQAAKLLGGFDGPMGVTYPLDLLLKNPLYKKRAWQHLLRWTSAAAPASLHS